MQICCVFGSHVKMLTKAVFYEGTGWSGRLGEPGLLNSWTSRIRMKETKGDIACLCPRGKWFPAPILSLWVTQAEDFKK